MPFIRRIRGRLNKCEDASSGRASHRATRSGVCSAIALGISSPKTTCMNVMSRKATGVATECAATPCHTSVTPSKQRLDEIRQGRLADEAKANAGQGDAELRGGDGTAQIGHRGIHRRGALDSLGDQFLDPRLAHRDQRKFSGDEEAVHDHKGRDGTKPDDVPHAEANSHGSSISLQQVIRYRSRKSRVRPSLKRRACSACRVAKTNFYAYWEHSAGPMQGRRTGMRSMPHLE